MTTPRTIEFYFDFASPYGYFGSLLVEEVAARHGCAVIWRPILLGAVFKVTGMSAMMHQPLRGAYLRRDVARFAGLLEVPLTMPEVMPVNGIAAARAYYWLEAANPARAKALAAAVYHAHWGEGRDVGPAAVVAEIGGRLGLDAAALLDGMQDPAIKARLRHETETAIARGVFGAPFFFVGNEPFWGADRLTHLERWLSTGGW
ncbi:MAG: 2-hydroxychromene-2-carboxylate isomerase [Rhodospirillaceae bacterium]